MNKPGQIVPLHLLVLCPGAQFALAGHGRQGLTHMVILRSAPTSNVQLRKTSARASVILRDMVRRSLTRLLVSSARQPCAADTAPLVHRQVVLAAPPWAWRQALSQQRSSTRHAENCKGAMTRCFESLRARSSLT